MISQNFQMNLFEESDVWTLSREDSCDAFLIERLGTELFKNTNVFSSVELMIQMVE